MKGWILYKRQESELSSVDHGVNHLLLAARLEGMSMHVYSPESFDLLVSSQGKASLFLDQKPVDLPDFVIPRMGAETSYFALAIIRELEALGVYVCNGAHTISLVKDKMNMSQMLRTNGLPTPNTILVKSPMSIALVQQKLGFPVVIKTTSGARGYGIHLCESAESLIDLLELISIQNSHSPLILQQFIASSYGRDLRVFTLGDQVIGCMQRIASSGFKANYSRGGRVEPYPITPELSYLALSAAKLFGLEIAGIDLLFDDKGGFTICEANSSPGFKGMEQAMGGNIAREIILYIKKVMEYN